MSAARRLTGSLDALSLAGLLQLLAAEGRTGRLDIEGPSVTGSLFLVAGAVVHATREGDDGAAPASSQDRKRAAEGAFDALVAALEGTFEFTPEVPAPARTLEGPTEQVLMESAVRRDHLRGSVPLSAVPSFAPVPAGGATPRFTTLQWRVLAAIDGKKDIATLAAEVSLPSEAIAALIHELEKAGVIRIT